MENVIVSLHVMWVVKSTDEEIFSFELNDVASAQAKVQELIQKHQFKSISKDAI